MVTFVIPDDLDKIALTIMMILIRLLLSYLIDMVAYAIMMSLMAVLLYLMPIIVPQDPYRFCHGLV